MTARHAETIVAIATPMGEGAIGIVRLSGPEAIAIVDSFFAGRRSLLVVPTHSLVYGQILDETGDTIDECLIGLMRAPGTFTGEDIVEINCHGGRLVIDAVLARALKAGAVPAERGEFTQRAFLNGRLDLSQAEAVIDIVRARSPRGLHVAAEQLKGALSRRVGDVRGRILHVLAHIQVMIDYPEEGVEELSEEELSAHLRTVLRDVDALIKGAEVGKVYRDGIHLAIVGRPNVGKSSLLNALLREERAIVTDIAGTTRDTIEAPALLGDVPITLTDTAGLRETDDPVEKIGVDRTRKAVESADLVLVVIDGSEPLTEDDVAVLDMLKSQERAVPSIVVLNKSDLPAAFSKSDIPHFCDESGVVAVSAISGEGLDALEKRAVRAVTGGIDLDGAPILVTRARHRAALERAKVSLAASIEAIESGMTTDVVSVDLQESLATLGEITGESVAEEVVAHIFAEFCVGK